MVNFIQQQLTTVRGAWKSRAIFFFQSLHTMHNTGLPLSAAQASAFGLPNKYTRHIKTFESSSLFNKELAITFLAEQGLQCELLKENVPRVKE